MPFQRLPSSPSATPPELVPDMPGVVRPPYGTPTGPLVQSAELFISFMSGVGTGYSSNLHVEEDTLLIDRIVPVAIRLTPESVLMRTDYPDGGISGFATGAGLRCVERDPMLATVVALQAVGLPAATWDLWATLDQAKAQQSLSAYAERGSGGPRGS